MRPGRRFGPAADGQPAGRPDGPRWSSRCRRIASARRVPAPAPPGSGLVRAGDCDGASAPPPPPDAGRPRRRGQPTGALRSTARRRGPPASRDPIGSRSRSTRIASASTCGRSGSICSGSWSRIATRSTRCRSRRSRRSSPRSSSAWPASRRASRCCRRSCRRAPARRGRRTRAAAVSQAAQAAAAAVSAASVAASAAPPAAPAPAGPGHIDRRRRLAAAPASRPTPRPTARAAPPRRRAGRRADAPRRRATRRSTALSGSRLEVKVERDGQVVGQANAEVNLPNLLATVFTTTRASAAKCRSRSAKDGELYTPTTAAQEQLEALRTSAIGAGSAAGHDGAARLDRRHDAGSDRVGPEVRHRASGRRLARRPAPRRRRATPALGLGFIGLALIGIVPLSARLTRNLVDAQRRRPPHRARATTARACTVRSNDEIGRLAAAFNQMADDVERHQRAAVEQERIRRELELGRQIQHDMLPQAPLLLGLTEIKGVSVPAREVGGDFFNYFQLRDGTHRAARRRRVRQGRRRGAADGQHPGLAAHPARARPGSRVARAGARRRHRAQHARARSTRRCSSASSIRRRARLRYVNAGHNPQYVLRTDGRARAHGVDRACRSACSPAAATPKQRVQLGAGDLLFFYTDGCVEAENASGEMFGIGAPRSRLCAAAAGQGADQVLAQRRSRGRTLPRRRRAVRRRDDDGRQGRLTVTPRRNGSSSRRRGSRR